MSKVNVLQQTVCMLEMDFRYVFAVASCEEIFFYDTQSPRPFAYVSHIHYATITDISWFVRIYDIIGWYDNYINF